MYMTPVSPFERAAQDWRAEVDAVAADLLSRGEARNPSEARDRAERIVQDRRKSERVKAGAETLAKVFAAGEPLKGKP